VIKWTPDNNSHVYWEVKIMIKIIFFFLLCVIFYLVIWPVARLHVPNGHGGGG
jgi:cytochrome bd-type quinol oxidase subunit 1